MKIGQEQVKKVTADIAELKTGHEKVTTDVGEIKLILSALYKD